MKLNLKRLIALFLVFSFTFCAFCEDEKKEKDTPQALKDIRRFEIIALGSMPFVTLDVTLAYSGYKVVSNGFDFSQMNIFGSKNYSPEEIKGILITSAGISLSIAVTDLIINIIKRKKIQRQNTSAINVYEIDLHLNDSKPDTSEDSQKDPGGSE